MIKRTMYFYDKKQADLIRKVNDKLHKQRGVGVRAYDATRQNISDMFKNNIGKFGPKLKQIIDDAQRRTSNSSLGWKNTQFMRKYYELGYIVYGMMGQVEERCKKLQDYINAGANTEAMKYAHFVTQNLRHLIEHCAEFLNYAKSMERYSGDPIYDNVTSKWPATVENIRRGALAVLNKIEGLNL